MPRSSSALAVILAYDISPVIEPASPKLGVETVQLTGGLSIVVGASTAPSSPHANSPGASANQPPDDVHDAS